MSKTDVEATYETPSYRVYYWKQPRHGIPDDVPDEKVGWHSWEYELTDCHNVQQVFAWADENALGRSYTLYAILDVPFVAREGEAQHRRTLIRLFGVDPTHFGHNEKPLWPGEIYFPPEEPST